MRTKSSWMLGAWASAMAVAGCGGGTAETPDAGADVGAVADAGNVRDVGVDAARTDGGLDAGANDTGTADAGALDASPDGGSDAAMPITFRIDSLDDTSCTTVEIVGSAGDDRGGVAVSGTRAYVTGDDATVAFGLDLPAGTAVIDGAALDDLVSDLATGQLYALANDTGPIGPSGGTRPGPVTRLLSVNETDGTIGTTAITLSTPITVDSGVGIFAGSGEIAIYDGAHLQQVDLATGTVTDLGALDVSSMQSCEDWAFYGVLEHVGTAHSVVAANGFDDRIVRIQVGTGDVSDLGSWTDLNDMCSISVAPSLGRWYFHNEGASQFDADTSEALAYCGAAFDTSPGNFQITALSSARCRVIEVAGLVGDDRGGIAVGASRVFLGGDGPGADPVLGSWSLALDAYVGTEPFTPTSGTTTSLDGLVTNFHTGEVYALATATELLTSAGGDVTRLVLLADDASATSTVITLSQAITLPASEVGIFSGWDELAIHDGTHLWHIALPSGTVTDLGLPLPPDHQTCESDYYFGVLEQIDGVRYLTVAYEDGPDPVISRTAVESGESTVVHTFTDINDMCSFSLSPTLGRWYFHHESSSQLTAGTSPSETLGFCGATFTHP
ncbi:MAG: hypothetical protein U0234_26985 [Sandaracinus sp.]